MSSRFVSVLKGGGMGRNPFFSPCRRVRSEHHFLFATILIFDDDRAEDFRMKRGMEKSIRANPFFCSSLKVKE